MSITINNFPKSPITQDSFVSLEPLFTTKGAGKASWIEFDIIPFDESKKKHCEFHYLSFTNNVSRDGGAFVKKVNTKGNIENVIIHNDDLRGYFQIVELF